MATNNNDKTTDDTSSSPSRSSSLDDDETKRAIRITDGSISREEKVDVEVEVKANNDDTNGDDGDDGDDGDSTTTKVSKSKSNSNSISNKYLTPELLEQEYDKFARMAALNQFQYEKLTSTYWIELIESFLLTEEEIRLHTNTSWLSIPRDSKLRISSSSTSNLISTINSGSNFFIKTYVT